MDVMLCIQHCFQFSRDWKITINKINAILRFVCCHNIEMLEMNYIQLKSDMYNM